MLRSQCISVVQLTLSRLFESTSIPKLSLFSLKNLTILLAFFQKGPSLGAEEEHDGVAGVFARRRRGESGVLLLECAELLLHGEFGFG